jgi:hypothetical protein
MMPIDFDHPSLISPKKEEIAYRYLDLDKFERLLKDRALFFCRADKFSDPFEASSPRVESIYRFLENKRLDKEAGRNSTDEELYKKAKDLGQLHKKYKRSFIVNCWHINKGESDAMWRLYLKTNEGVAIQSTVQKIVDAYTSNPETIYISRVRYIDYENDTYYHRTEYPQNNYNLFTPIVHKRNAFSHESELRLFQQIEGAVNDETYWDRTSNYMGRSITCNIDQLIDKIILPPTADIFVENKVKALLDIYKFDYQIEGSKLNLIPRY